MTPQTVITQVRALINDDSTVIANRYTDAELLGYVNQAVKRFVLVRPDLFITDGTITPTENQVEQTLPASAVRLMEINRVTGGDAIQEVDKQTMDMNYPEWTAEASGTPYNWMRHPRNPTKYFLYPAPSSGVTLKGEYIDTPDDYTLSDAIDLPEAYFGALVDATIFMAESVDTESVGSGRAKFYYDSFMEALGADFAQRAVVDDEGGQVGAQQRRPRQQQGSQ